MFVAARSWPTQTVWEAGEVCRATPGSFNFISQNNLSIAFVACAWSIEVQVCGIPGKSVERLPVHSTSPPPKLSIAFVARGWLIEIQVCGRPEKSVRRLPVHSTSFFSPNFSDHYCVVSNESELYWCQQQYILFQSPWHDPSRLQKNPVSRRVSITSVDRHFSDVR